MFNKENIKAFLIKPDGIESTFESITFWGAAALSLILLFQCVLVFKIIVHPLQYILKVFIFLMAIVILIYYYDKITSNPIEAMEKIRQKLVFMDDPIGRGAYIVLVGFLAFYVSWWTAAPGVCLMVCGVACFMRALFPEKYQKVAEVVKTL